ncbi:hypothetical protein [Komagataeibacter sp. FNDCF1]|uniref:hypothetical protein n=1 Tax=Komagataeibacter sp. FNDCF1 TaxID=2878681 RepID=UPI001E3935E3|nr:hypothetical protein [Komagataeibacter sp. FNDCF1]MCE2565399.1 hypothetical protein [Komagataeibacter sp. FNDCF1]
MRAAVLISGLALLPFMALQAHAQNAPAGQSSVVTGESTHTVSSAPVPAGRGKQFDANGMSLSGNPSILTCPVASCPTRDAAGGPVRTALAIYGQTTLANPWEYELYSGLYSNTGRGSSTDPKLIAAPGAKMAAYFGLMQGQNSGPGWGLNWNILRNAVPGGINSLYGQPGSGTPGKPGAMDDAMSTIGAEGDISNWQGDTDTHNAFVVNLFLNTTSRYTSTAGIYLGASPGQTVASYHTGIYFGGKNNGGTADSVSGQTIWDRSGANYGYYAMGNHATAAFFDQSTGQNGLLITGTKTGQDIWLNTSSSIGAYISGSHLHGDLNIRTSSHDAITIAGTHTGSAFSDASTSASAGLMLNGKYSTAAINTARADTPVAINLAKGQRACFNDGANCVMFDGSKLVYIVGTTRVASIDNNGNMVIKGTLTQSGRP